MHYKPSQFHSLEANFKRPLLNLTADQKNSIFDKLSALYGKPLANRFLPQFERIIAVYYAYKTDHMIEWEHNQPANERFSEKDAVLITYGDLIKNQHQKPLETLAELCEEYLNNVFNTIHILPFFPYSSDRGFAIMDFRQVDPNLGTWDNINRIHDHFKLMFDGVFNHISSKSYWFQEFLNGNPEFAHFFTVYSPLKKPSKKRQQLLLRPRTSEVLTQFYTYLGKRYVWTTFSPDQVDLKFQNPKVLLKMTEILLYYVRRGADIIRLDAVTYLWDEPGTSGAHLWQTHMIIKLMREILNITAPHVSIITETNVPHNDNISYFGNGYDEAQMVYNFALPPLVLHSILTENTTKLTEWAKNLEPPSNQATYFNFLDSHDGIGLAGARGILSDEEVNVMIQKTLEHGGFISYKTDKNGIEIPYELNITFFSAVNNANICESATVQTQRYMAARSIPLVLNGIPGIYFHGLLGSTNDIDAIKKGAEKRSINRNIILKNRLVSTLKETDSLTHSVFYNLGRMIQKRQKEKVFHPNAGQKILDISEKLFSIMRTSPDNKEIIIAVTNLSNSTQSVHIDLRKLTTSINKWHDILHEKSYTSNLNSINLELPPYEIIWLKGLV